MRILRSHRRPCPVRPPSRPSNPTRPTGPCRTKRTTRPWRRQGPATLVACATLVAASCAGRPATQQPVVVHTTAASGGAVAATTVDDPAQYVNPFVGTQSPTDDYGGGGMAGNTFPGAVAPLGMVQWSPDTVSRQPGGYVYDDNRIHGFSLTHISGAGCGDYDNVPFMPFLGSTPVASSTFSHTNESASPGTYSVTLDDGIRTDLAATPRSGIAQFSYPAGQQASLTVDAGTAANAATGSITLGSAQLSGYTDSGNFCNSGNHYRLYFTVAFDHPFSQASVSGGSLVQLSFDTTTSQTVTARVGLSFVSVAGAQANLQAEQGSDTFGQVQTATRASWDSMLSRIAVSGGSSTDTRTFYTALYHALQDPSVFSDVNGQYIGFDGQQHTVAAGHTQYADFSGWDIYRSQIQLLALLAPQQASDIGQSIVNQGQQDGYLDRWTLANTGTGVMVGDPMTIIASDLYAFGATGFDAQTLLQLAVTGAENDKERGDHEGYDAMGYVPASADSESASVTLEYASADFAISQLAQRLGNSTVWQEFLHRAQDWRNLLNSGTGYIGPRNTDHSFQAQDPTSSSGFAEGTSSQYTWLVPQNLQGLIATLGGDSAVSSRLDAFFGHLNAGTNAPYAYLGNEPSVATPWIYDYAGSPSRTQAVVRQALTTLFSDAPNGEPGNDDLGELSSWAVWAAVGLYPEVPGRSELAMASPLFPAVTITRGNGVVINLNAPAAADNAPYVTGLTVNGAPSDQPWLPESLISNGGTLQYALSSTASSWGSAAADAPPSFDVGPATPVTGQVTGLAGKCMDVLHSQTASGTPVQIWDCNGTAAQQWTLASDGSLQAFGSCLDVTQSGTADNTKVQLWTCNGTGAQQWWPRPDGSLLNPPSGRCLDLPNSDTTDGNQLQIYDCNGTGAQKWTVP
ncbi:GH92 family glycosyl hydrolase [Kitasatospora sp. NBC_01250]|uniref:GH92 family glycosyl hydrolase n=1 Tax=Kitasatospora sp. NBC_01250 TaxID=2903571 RepID=UPI002E374A94|nr:GH92 family glycosyl hydrolase [Kitasatospora sp. NBC_01250]